MVTLTKINNELEIEREKLRFILDLTNAINENAKIDYLLKSFKVILSNKIGVKQFAFFNHHNDWKCILKYGVKEVSDHFDFLSLKIDKIIIVKDRSEPIFNGVDVLIPVFHKDKALSFLMLGDLGDGNDDYANYHLGFVQTIANIVSVSIENKMFSNQLMEKKIADYDLEVAAEMQSMLFPTKLPSDKKVDVAAQYIPKQLVGGDYYDFIRFSDHEYFFCIADVSGKGISAALLMSNFQANVRANVKYNHQNLTLKEFVIELNKNVMAAANGEKFVTAFIGYYNEQTRQLKYINAGHNYPVMIKNREAKLLKVGCTGLGMFDDLPNLNEEIVYIEPNTVIVCYTDGVVEIEDEKGEQYEIERLVDIVASNFDAKMKTMTKIIFNSLDDFKGSRDYLDDTAILSLRIK